MDTDEAPSVTLEVDYSVGKRTVKVVEASLTKQDEGPSNSKPRAGFKDDHGDDAGETIKLSLNPDLLVKLESAFQMHWRGSVSTVSRRRRRLSYAVFRKLAAKLDTHDSIATLCNLPDGSPLLALSKEERLWHDLYCVAVPVLYQCDGSEGESTTTTTPNRQAAELVWADLPIGSNRISEFRRLVQSAMREGVPKTKSQEALRRLEVAAQGEPNKKKRKIAEVKKVDTMTVDDLLGVSAGKPKDKTGTVDLSETCARPVKSTIEERIQARAKERERNLEKARKAHKDPREDRVAVADALYAHACRVLRQASSQQSSSGSRFKGSRIASASSASASASASSDPKTTGTTNVIPKKTRTKCLLTFGDVVLAISSRSRSEITRLLVDIQDNAPGWIKWRNLQQDGIFYSVPIAKNAQLWIETADYKRVRAVLNGEASFETRIAAASGPKQHSVGDVQRTPVPGTTKKAAAVTVSTKKPSISKNSGRS